MKNINTIILALILLSSCASIKRKIAEKVCDKDTVQTYVTIVDTLLITEVKTDTIFSTQVDSIVLVKDNLIIKYKKIKDKIYLSGQIKADTIYQEKKVFVKVPCNCPPLPQPTWIDRAVNWLAVFGVISLLLLIALAVPYKK